MLKKIIAIATLLLFLLLPSCQQGEQPEEAIQPEEQIAPLPESGPIEADCIFTADIVRQTCNIDASIPLRMDRQDLPSAYSKRCWIIHGFPEDSETPRLRTASNTLLSYDADRLSDLKKDSFEAFKRTKTRIEGKQPPEKVTRELSDIGDEAFVTYNPTVSQLTRQEPYPSLLEEAAEIAMFARKNDIVFQLEFSQKGKLMTGVIGETRVVGAVELCSVKEGTILLQRMLGQMVRTTRAPETQRYSGCALTAEIVEEKCNIDLIRDAELTARFLHNVCEIGATLPASAVFSVANFQEVSELPITSVTDIPGLGDRAVLKDTLEGKEIYFQVGERRGKLALFGEKEGEEVYVYDARQGKAVPIGGGCSVDEAKELIATTLVSYFQGNPNPTLS